MELSIGQVVKSKAGRDGEKFLAVIELRDGYALICDGKERPIERPKRKNPMHLAPTRHKLGKESMETNRALRKALREFASGESEG